MAIDPKLSKGLTQRFFNEYPDMIGKIGKNMLKDIKGVKKKHHKFFSVFENNIKDYVIFIETGGSKRQPYMCVDLMGLDLEREYNSWNEKSLYSAPIFFQNRQTYDGIGTFNIGEHAIRRIIERKIHNIDGYSIPSIINEMIWINILSNLYLHIIAESDFLPFWDNATLIIPAPNGMFMAGFHKESWKIEIRTYLSKNQLTDAQQLARACLVNAIRPIYRSPASYRFSFTGFDLVDTYSLLNLRAYRQLGEDARFDHVLNCICHDIHDSHRITIKSNIRKSIINNGKLWLEDFENLLQESINNHGDLNFFNITCKSFMLSHASDIKE